MGTLRTRAGITAARWQGGPAVLPFGGDVAMARSIAAAHQRTPWTGRCRACRDRHPCRDRQDANMVLAHPGPSRQRPAVAGLAVTVVPVLLGLLLIAASVAEVAR